MINLVSICIPCYNSSRFIIETLDSIEKQSYENIELIIIDDNSSDATFEIIQNWALGKKWVKAFKNDSNLGLVKTANKLLDNSKGAYIQFVGHDDILLQNKIEKQLIYLNTLPGNVAMVYSNVSVIDEDDEIIEEDYLVSQGYNSQNMQFDDVTAQLLSHNFIPAISVLIKTGCMKRAGRLDEALSFEDLDMWLRISLSFDIAYFPEVTAWYRRNRNSLMHNQKSKIHMLASLLDCREKYRGIKPEWDKIINKGIIQTAPALYRYHHSSGKYWLQRRLKYDKRFKSWVYWLCSKVNSRIIWSKTKAIEL